MRRGRRWVPSAPGTMPRPTSGRANVAWSAATRKSQASEISNPPPSARPLMAATVGICSQARLSPKEFRAVVRPPLVGLHRAPLFQVRPRAERLLPGAGQYERSHVSGALYLYKPRSSSSAILTTGALERSGRLSVTVATRFSIETSISSNLPNTSLLPRLADPEPGRTSPSLRASAQTDQIFPQSP